PNGRPFFVYALSSRPLPVLLASSMSILPSAENALASGATSYFQVSLTLTALRGKKCSVVSLRKSPLLNSSFSSCASLPSSVSPPADSAPSPASRATTPCALLLPPLGPAVAKPPAGC